MEAVQKLAGLPHFLKRFGVDENRLDNASAFYGPPVPIARPSAAFSPRLDTHPLFQRPPGHIPRPCEFHQRHRPAPSPRSIAPLRRLAPPPRTAAPQLASGAPPRAPAATHLHPARPPSALQALRSCKCVAATSLPLSLSPSRRCPTDTNRAEMCLLQAGRGLGDTNRAGMCLLRAGRGRDGTGQGGEAGQCSAGMRRERRRGERQRRRRRKGKGVNCNELVYRGL